MDEVERIRHLWREGKLGGGAAERLAWPVLLGRIDELEAVVDAVNGGRAMVILWQEAQLAEARVGRLRAVVRGAAEHMREYRLWEVLESDWATVEEKAQALRDALAALEPGDLEVSDEP